MKLLVALVLALLAEAVLAQCPAHCTCQISGTTYTLDCSPSTAAFRYTSIPDDGPVQTTVMIMTGNELSRIIPGNFSKYTELEELYLDRNLLSEIDVDYFGTGLSRLTVLSLDGNPITRISDGAFSNLTSLQNLTLRNTMLTTVQADAFIGLNNLRLLSFDGSAISELPGDFFTHTRETSLVSLANNQLAHLLPDILSTVNRASFNIDLSSNPWECDCLLVPLRDYLLANPDILEGRLVCRWPLESRGVSFDAVTDPSSFTCYQPEILTHPQSVSLLTGDTLTIDCNISALPRPDVTWLQDDVAVVYDERRQLLEDGSLLISTLVLADAGIYQCQASNLNGTVESSTGMINITEATCFDGISSPHETDIDCGGEFCAPCEITQMCLVDSDCEDDLVCLFAYELPSGLDYISRSSPLAFTCNTMENASLLLEERTQNSLPEVLGLDFTFDEDLSAIQQQIREALAAQFNIPVSTITSANVITIQRAMSPLIQIHFSLQHNSAGEGVVSRLREQLHDGQLGGTLKIIELDAAYNIRINL